MKTREIKIFIFLFLVGICYSSLYAQQDEALSIRRGDRGKIEFARFSIEENKRSFDRKSENDVNFLKSMLQVKEVDEFRLKSKTTDSVLGVTTKKFQQYYKGIKVDNAQYLLHIRDGLIEVMNGHFRDINIQTVEPSLDERQALQRALNYVGAEQYMWEEAGRERFIKERKNDLNATYYPKGELVIAKDNLREEDICIFDN